MTLSLFILLKSNFIFRPFIIHQALSSQLHSGSHSVRHAVCRRSQKQRPIRGFDHIRLRNTRPMENYFSDRAEVPPMFSILTIKSHFVPLLEVCEHRFPPPVCPLSFFLSQVMSCLSCSFLIKVFPAQCRDPWKPEGSPKEQLIRTAQSPGSLHAV